MALKILNYGSDSMASRRYTQAQMFVDNRNQDDIERCSFLKWFNITNLVTSGTTNVISKYSIAPQIYTWKDELISEINELKEIETDMDFEAPNEIARQRARIVLDLLDVYDLRPDSVGACPDEGVTFTFTNDKWMAAIETYNSGEIIAVTTEKYGQPEVWEVQPDRSILVEVIKQIRSHLKL